jgi:hypothetical protein
MSFPRPAVPIIPCKEKSILITHDFHLPIDWDGDIREYPKVGEVPIEIVKRAFEEIGGTMGQVGAELGREQRLGMSYQDFLRVQDSLPAISFFDAADIFWKNWFLLRKAGEKFFHMPLGNCRHKKYHISLNLSSTDWIL